MINDGDYSDYYWLGGFHGHGGTPIWMDYKDDDRGPLFMENPIYYSDVL